MKSLSRVQLFVTPWTISLPGFSSLVEKPGFYRQEYLGGLPFPSLGDLPDPGIEPGSPVLQADSLLTELWGKPHFVLITVFFAFISFSLFPKSAYASSSNRFDDCSLQISVTWFYHLSRLSIDVYMSLFSHRYLFSWFLVSVIFFTRSWTLGMRESFPR